MIEVWALDDLTATHRLDHKLKSLALIEHDLDVGTWTLTLDWEPGGPAAKWYGSTWPGIEVVDTDTGWSFSGFLNQAKIEIRGGVKLELVASGFDWQDDLDRRVILPNHQNVSEAYQTVTHTDLLVNAAYRAVRNNALDAALPHRAVRNLQVATPVGALPTRQVTWNAENQAILPQLRTWFDASDWTCRTVLTRDGATPGSDAALFWFARPRVRANTAVDNRRVQAATIIDRAAPVSRLIGIGGTWPEGVAARRHLLWAHGEWFGGSPGDSEVIPPVEPIPADPDPIIRYVTEGAIADENQSWRTRYRERVASFGADTFDALVSRKDTEVETMGPTLAWQSVKVDALDLDPDIMIGDLVPVEAVTVLDADPSQTAVPWSYLPIMSHELRVTEAGAVTRTVSLGERARPDAATLRRMRERLERLEASGPGSRVY